MDALLLCILFVVICLIIFDWYDNSNFNCAKIQFSSFKKFYAINPLRWQFKKGMVRCCAENNNVYEMFRFGFLDYFKFMLWKKRLEKHNKQEKHKQSINRMMEVVRQDIAEAELKAKQMKYQGFDDLVKWAGQNTNKDIIDLQKLIEEYKKYL